MDAEEVWLSVEEVRILLGVGERQVRIHLKAEKYLSRQVAAKGAPGGKKYEILLASLPKSAQKAYFNRIQAQLPEEKQAGLRDGLKLQLAADMQAKRDEITSAQGNRGYLGLRGKAKSRADAKLDILAALDRYMKASGQKAKKGYTEFCVEYNRGFVQGLDEARTAIPDISIASLYRWKSAEKSQGAVALAGKYGHRKGSGKIDSQPALKEYVVGMMAGMPHGSAKNIWRGLCARFAADAGVELPSLRSLERWVADWQEQNKELALAMANPDAWKNRHMVAFGDASAGIERLNQLWEMDSTPADVMLTDGRHHILGVIDVYSRRMKLLVSKTSRATAIALLMRRTILDWGVPEAIKTDNGSDYTSNHIRRALRFLGIEHELCPPFQGWRKPHIERGLGSFSHGPVELMAGFIGHNVAERQAIRAKQSFAERLMTKNAVVEMSLSAAELQRYCDQWADTIYYLERHEGMGQTPQQRVVGWNGAVKVVTDPRALDLLLAEAPGDGYRTVTKNGLRIDNDDYIAPELALYVGRRLHVLYDPEDLGRVYTYADDQGQFEFVCVAECPDRTGISRQQVAAKATEMQKANIQKGRKELKQLSKKVGLDKVLDEIHETAAKADNVVRLRPHDTETHTTAALDAAAEAAKAAGLERLGDKSEAEIIDMVKAMDAKVASGAKREEPDFDSTYQRAMWLWERAIKEEPLNGEQSEFIQDYRKLEPRSWRSLDDLLKAKWGERYLGIRDARLGLKK